MFVDHCMQKWSRKTAYGLAQRHVRAKTQGMAACACRDSRTMHWLAPIWHAQRSILAAYRTLTSPGRRGALTPPAALDRNGNSQAAFSTRPIATRHHLDSVVRTGRLGRPRLNRRSVSCRPSWRARRRRPMPRPGSVHPPSASSPSQPS